MKRLCLILTALSFSALLLAACAARSYTVVYYETEERRDNALSFEMKDVGTLSEVVLYGAADGSLGETVYAAPASEGSDELTATLAFRMAKADYARKFSESTGAPGISEIAADDAVKTERIGSYTVTYYTSGSVAFAIWEDSEFSYSAAFTTADKTAAAPESVSPYVIAVISSKS